MTISTVIKYDIRPILRLPSELFLSAAFWSVLGRQVDLGGGNFYASKLELNYPRSLILAEIRCSEEGEKYASQYLSEDLEKIVFFYKALKALPFRKLRWKLMPGFGMLQEEDQKFDWGSWKLENFERDKLRLLKNSIKMKKCIVKSSGNIAEQPDYTVQKINDFLTIVDGVALKDTVTVPCDAEAIGRINIESLLSFIEDELEKSPSAYKKWVLYGYILNKIKLYDESKKAYENARVLASNQSLVISCFFAIEMVGFSEKS